MCMTKNQWMLVGGAIVLLVLLAVYVFYGPFAPAPGHDTPIVIAGGSIRAHCYAKHGCDANGWTVAPKGSTSYTVEVFSSIKEVALTEKPGTDEADEVDDPDYTQDHPLRSAIDLGGVGNAWTIEIDASSPGAQTIDNAITIVPVSTDTSGHTLQITITNNAPKSAKWEQKQASKMDSEIRFRGNRSTCVADQSPHDPLGHCDILSTVRVTLEGNAQDPVTCATSGIAGKCKIKLNY